MADKVLFATRAREQATRLATLISETEELVDSYFDRGHNGGGADPIADGDITSVGITAAQLGSFITLSQQLKNFRDNAGVTQGDYGSTLNKLRMDL